MKIKNSMNAFVENKIEGVIIIDELLSRKIRLFVL